ncbi:MAG: glycosyltransferase [Myxococcota bacterium]
MASDTGAVRELVDDGRTGFVVPVADTDALVAAMSRLETMPRTERAALGAAGRARVAERYALDAVVDQWEALYDDALSGGPPPPPPPGPAARS